MQHYIVRCKHCCTMYTWQAAGEYNMDFPKEYSSSDYCPECKKTIVDALSKIPAKRQLVFVESDEFTPNVMFGLIKKKEEDIIEKNKGSNFPIIRRVFAGMYDSVRGVSSRQDQIIIKKNKNGRNVDVCYFYRYFPGYENEMEIKVAMEKDLVSGEILGYWENNFWDKTNLL